MPTEYTALITPQIHPDYLRSATLGREITELCGYLYAATYRLLVMIRQFDQEGLWQLEGIHSCAHWLNWKCGIGMGAAREKVRVANALAGLPKISEAFSRGEVSYSKVRAMTRIATPKNEDYLLMIARHGTASHIEGPRIPIDSDILVYLKKDLNGVEIDPHTCVSKWEGERIDWPLAVGHLYS